VEERKPTWETKQQHLTYISSYLCIVHIHLLLPDVNTIIDTVLMKNTVKVKVVLNVFLPVNSAVNMAF